jgi:hypothetical protein
MAEMVCIEFEALLGDYIGRELDAEVRTRFAEHSLRCLSCRKLLDDVKSRLSESDHDRVSMLPEMDADLETIPRRHGSLNCSGFRELITEFLDGFVPASIYHKFVGHSDECSECSGVLTGVVYAVAACHSVHMYEELEVPAELNRNLMELPCSQKWGAGSTFDCDPLPSVTRAAGRPLYWRLTKAARALGRLLPRALPGFVTASSLIAGSAAMLIFGSPGELGWLGIYHRAQSKPAVADSQNPGSADSTSQGEMEDRIGQVESDIGKAWRTVGTRRVGALADEPSAGMRAGTGAATTSLIGK